MDPASESESQPVVTAKMAYLLYWCHFLSTWNARVYEFAAVVFTAAAFPGDLMASSIFGMTMRISLLIFASLLGTWVDRGSSRLTTLIMTISTNRISVIAAYCCWFFIVGLQTTEGPLYENPKAEMREVEEASGFQFGLKARLFVAILFLSVIERLSRTANLFSIERDWVPALAAPETLSKVQETPPKFGLTQLNAVMSRIDLVCQLISPIFLSTFISAVGNLQVCIFAILCLNGLTWSAEIWSATSVWNSSDRLQESKRLDPRGDRFDDETSMLIGRLNNTPVDQSRPWWHRSSQRVYHAFRKVYLGVATWLQDYSINLRIYFAYPVWLPSIAFSILHFSVLHYSGTLTTYLLISGFSLNLITVAKTLSAVAELSSTFIIPYGVRKTRELWARYDEKVVVEEHDVLLHAEEDETMDLLSGHSQEEDHDNVDVDCQVGWFPKTDMGVAVLGFWALLEMFFSLIPPAIALAIFSFSTPSSSSPSPTPFSPLLLLLLLLLIPLSRLGRRTNLLTTQQLTQTLVPPHHRSAFAGAETGFVSLFGLAHWVVTAIWSTHEKFGYFALGSVGAVAGSVGIYAVWLGARGESELGRGVGGARVWRLVLWPFRGRGSAKRGGVGGREGAVDGVQRGDAVDGR